MSWFSWIWLALALTFFVAALRAADDLYTYGWYAHDSWMKVWLMGLSAIVAVVMGVPLANATYRYLTSSGSGVGVAVWVALVIALAMDSILVHDVGRTCKKLRRTWPMVRGHI